MNFRSLTWQQVALVAIAVVGVIIAYKFLGVNAAAVATVISHFVLASSGKDGDPPAPNAPEVQDAPTRKSEFKAAPPVDPVVAVAFASLALIVAGLVVGCSSWGPQVDGDKLLAGSRKIDMCEYAAEQAPDGGNLAAWRACRAEAGIP